MIFFYLKFICVHHIDPRHLRSNFKKMSNKNNIQGFFKSLKESLGKHEVPYNEDHWRDMEKMLDKEFVPNIKKPLGLSGFKIFLSSVAAVVTIAAITLIYLDFNAPKQNQQGQAIITHVSKHEPDLNSQNTISTENQQKNAVSIENGKQASLLNNNENLSSEAKDKKQIKKTENNLLKNNDAKVKNQLAFKSNQTPQEKHNKKENIDFKNTSTHNQIEIPESKNPTNYQSLNNENIIANSVDANPRPLNAGKLESNIDEAKALSTFREDLAEPIHSLAFIDVKNTILLDTLFAAQDSIAELNNPYQDSIGKPCDTCLLPFFGDKLIYPIEYIQSASFQTNAAFTGLNNGSISMKFPLPLATDADFSFQYTLGKNKRLGIGAAYNVITDSTILLKNSIFQLYNKHLINASTSYLVLSLPNHKIRIGSGITYNWGKEYYTTYEVDSLQLDTLAIPLNYVHANIGALYYSNKLYFGLGINTILMASKTDMRSKTKYSVSSGIKIPFNENNMLIPHILFNVEKQNIENSSLSFSNSIGVDWNFLTRGAYLRSSVTRREFLRSNGRAFHGWSSTRPDKKPPQPHILLVYPGKIINGIMNATSPRYQITNGPLLYPNCITKSYLLGLGIDNFNTLTISAVATTGLAYNYFKKQLVRRKASFGAKLFIPLTKTDNILYYGFDSYYPFRIDVAFTYHF